LLALRLFPPVSSLQSLWQQAAEVPRHTHSYSAQVQRLWLLLCEDTWRPRVD
jgi:hypothetical protein